VPRWTCWPGGAAGPKDRLHDPRLPRTPPALDGSDGGAERRPAPWLDLARRLRPSPDPGGRGLPASSVFRPCGETDLWRMAPPRRRAMWVAGADVRAWQGGARSPRSSRPDSEWGLGRGARRKGHRQAGHRQKQELRTQLRWARFGQRGLLEEYGRGGPHGPSESPRPRVLYERRERELTTECAGRPYGPMALPGRRRAGGFLTSGLTCPQGVDHRGTGGPAARRRRRSPTCQEGRSTWEDRAKPEANQESGSPYQPGVAGRTSIRRRHPPEDRRNRW